MDEVSYKCEAFARSEKFLVCAFLLYIKYLETSRSSFLRPLIGDVVEASVPSSRRMSAGER